MESSLIGREGTFQEGIDTVREVGKNGEGVCLGYTICTRLW